MSSDDRSGLSAHPECFLQASTLAVLCRLMLSDATKVLGYVKYAQAVTNHVRPRQIKTLGELLKEGVPVLGGPQSIKYASRPQVVFENRKRSRVAGLLSMDLEAHRFRNAIKAGEARMDVFFCCSVSAICRRR